MTVPFKFNLARSLLAGIVSLLVSPLLIYTAACLSRPPRTTLPEQQLFQGITYRRMFRVQPRPIMLHVVTVDLTAPGIKFLATPGKATLSGMDTKAQTTSDFLRQHQLQLAINANFFLPFHERTPWDYYPHKGNPVNTLGLAVSNGKTYSPAAVGWSVLCISANNRVQIQYPNCPTDTIQAVAGNRILLDRGQPVPLDPNVDNSQPFPSTAVAINRQGNKLWLVVVDGRQFFYSEGVTLGELRNIFLELGADTVLNLDGGGSATLVAEIDGKSLALNSPIHTRIPTRQRPVANHLGIYALPK